MSTIRVIYAAEPSFPATDQHPDAVRYQIGNVWVDAIGGAPTQAEVDAVLAAALAPQVRRDLFAAQADAADLLTRLQTATPAQVDTWLTNNVTTLAQARTVLGTIVKVLAARLAA